MARFGEWRPYVPVSTRRENAERELSKAGQAVVPYLQSLDRKQLDAEQAARVRTLIETLSVGYEDRADRIATWLSGDEQVWFSLLARPVEVKRRVAARQLASMLGTPIDFDPAAEATVRQQQWERLRARLRQKNQTAPDADR